MKYILLLIIICISIDDVYGQSAEGGITWQRVMNNDGIFRKSQQCSDSGYIAIGSHIYPLNERKIYIVKYNLYGDTQWVKLHNLNDNISYDGYWIQETSDKGFIIGASISEDAYLMKIDKNGNYLWHRIYGGPGIEQIWCVKQTFENEYIAALRTTTYGTNDIRIIKIDSTGESVWDKTLINNSTESANEILITNTYFYLIGSIGIGISAEIYLLKYNYNGDTIWTKYYGGSKTDGGYSIDKTDDNGFIIGGISNSFNSQNNFESFILKLDSAGIVQWQRTYSTYIGEHCNSIRTISNKGYVFCGIADSGFSADKAFIKIIDIFGNILNEQFYVIGQNSNEFRSVELINDNGFILSGFAVFTGQFSKGLIVKTDSNGYATPIGIINNYEFQPIKSYLHQIYPNPFNSSTLIKYSISHFGLTELSIYDIQGRLILNLLNENRSSGNYSYILDLGKYNFASGIYILKLSHQSNNIKNIDTRKLIYIK